MTVLVERGASGLVNDCIGQLMTEHPGWRRSQDGDAFGRLFRAGDVTFSVSTHRSGWHVEVLSGSGHVPSPDVFSLKEQTPCSEIRRALDESGPVVRFRNPDIWDALAVAIIRQVIRAPHAKRMYQLFCETYGEQHVLADGTACALVPPPEVVLRLTDTQFDELGMAFKRRPLRHAAAAVLEHHEQWTNSAVEELVDTLQATRGIGPWTARAAAADLTNDWSMYPYGDLAVRTWATRAAPQTCWPTAEPEFEDAWRAAAGDELSALTVMVLAWGSRRGVIG